MTHYWPADDPFTDGYTPTHYTWEPYLHLFAWNSDPAYGVGGTGFSIVFSTWDFPCMLYSGWYGQTVPPQPGASANPAAMLRKRIGTPGPGTSFVPAAFVWRPVTLLDCSVEMSWQIQTDNPAGVSAGLQFMMGVGARLSGGTFNNLESERTWVNTATNGYWFIVASKSTTPFGFKFELVSVNAGVPTRLIDTPVGIAAFNSFASGNFLQTQRLRMTVQAEGPDVRIKCYATLETDIGAGETLIFNFLDNTATKIVSTGCAGIITSNERKPSGTFICATCTNWWRIASVDNTTTLYLQEEWSRTNPQGGFFEDATVAWRTGWNLMSGWYGDVYSAPGVWPLSTTCVLFHDKNEHGLDKLSFYPNNLSSAHNTQIDGILISQRPADLTGTQDRTITGRYSSAGTGGLTQQNAFGIALRCSPVPPSALPNCYYCVHSIDYGALTAKVQLYRSSFDGLNLIAEKTTGIAYALDTDIFLRMTIASVLPDNIARIRIRIAGVLVVLVAPAVPVSGVTIAGDGTVDDASNERVLTGPGEGLYVRHRQSTPILVVTHHPFFLDTWTQGAGETYDPIEPPPPPPPPADLTPIAVSTEIAGAFGTLVLGVGGQWEVELMLSDPGIVHKYENDTAQSFPIDNRIRRSWTITNSAVGSAADAALLVFFDAHGCDTPFSWVTDDGDTAYAVFTTPDLAQTMRSAQCFKYSFGLQERFP